MHVDLPGQQVAHEAVLQLLESITACLFGVDLVLSCLVEKAYILGTFGGDGGESNSPLGVHHSSLVSVGCGIFGLLAYLLAVMIRHLSLALASQLASTY